MQAMTFNEVFHKRVGKFLQLSDETIRKLEAVAGRPKAGELVTIRKQAEVAADLGQTVEAVAYAKLKILAGIGRPEPGKGGDFFAKLDAAKHTPEGRALAVLQHHPHARLTVADFLQAEEATARLEAETGHATWDAVLTDLSRRTAAEDKTDFPTALAKVRKARPDVVGMYEAEARGKVRKHALLIHALAAAGVVAKSASPSTSPALFKSIVGLAA